MDRQCLGRTRRTQFDGVEIDEGILVFEVFATAELDFDFREGDAIAADINRVLRGGIAGDPQGRVLVTDAGGGEGDFEISGSTGGERGDRRQVEHEAGSLKSAGGDL